MSCFHLLKLGTALAKYAFNQAVINLTTFRKNVPTL